LASITKRGGSYRITVNMPDGKGDYIRKTSTYKPAAGFTPTQARRGAEKYAIEFEDRVKGLVNYDEGMSLNELFTWYMENIAPNRLKEQTQYSYADDYNRYLKPILGHCKLKQLTPVVIDGAFKQIKNNGATRQYYTLTDIIALEDALTAVGGSYRKMEKKGVISVNVMIRITRGGKTLKAQAIADYCGVPLLTLFTPVSAKPLNPNTIIKIKNTLGTLLATATRKGIIRNNPMANTEPIKASSAKRSVLNIEQAKLFMVRLRGLDNISARALLVTALYSGLRSGELRALTWADIDTQRGLIYVNKTIDNRGNITAPKTKSSVRYVQIDISLCSFLKGYHSEQQTHIKSMRGRVADNNIVFPAITTGGYMNHCYPNEVIKRLIINTDIPQDLHIHSLRHSFTSILINEGADAKRVQAALGHSSAKTTLDIYAHVFSKSLAESVQSVAFALTGEGDNIFGAE